MKTKQEQNNCDFVANEFLIILIALYQMIGAQTRVFYFCIIREKSTMTPNWWVSNSFDFYRINLILFFKRDNKCVCTVHCSVLISRYIAHVF